MEEHKYNPTAQKAKAGLLPPKPIPVSKREQERKAYVLIQKYLEQKTGFPISEFTKDYFL